MPGDESILIIVGSTCICTMFRNLINIYEKSLAGETEKPLTVLHLQVFWNMVQMQVLPTMIRILSSPGTLHILQEKFYLHLDT